MTEAFSIPRHCDFLGGYLDAVARSLTTDTELVGLSVTFADAVACDDDCMTDNHQRVPIENWSREFCAFVEGFLGIDARSRPDFYLVDYLCWFRHFSDGATCHRYDHHDPTTEVRYHVEWPEGCLVLLIANRTTRMPSLPGT